MKKQSKKVSLACIICKQKNYSTNKSIEKKRLEINKFCRFCNAKTLHKEEK
ncbi:50S ribosomal protein L33 [Mycoplasma miroungirhinis]|uniref:Large ribosomal subunit protein bL33 n=1 Tax=Mycoplasma miroungirhinis TaxID=754516 RepID=A0A6M4JCS8_9MOLU|nr:50S ribosomal protein L33 [Mycoplasma miroungirhinis]QJR43869.1 50S ribosomal protein L33 [Mycoplasma miroungirhinis]